MSKTWLITGATRGLGVEIAKAALAAGDNVVVTGRSTSQLESVYASYGERSLALQLDITNEAQTNKAVADAVASFGRIDVLVNNAGYGHLGTFEEIEQADIEKQFVTNVFGLMQVTRAALPILRKQRSGHIFNISSVGGTVGFKQASVYCASKFAVEGFSESLAMEIAQFGITLTIVEPGYFRTDFLDKSSIRYGTLTIDDYAESTTESKNMHDDYSHKQLGDPAILGDILVRLANDNNPPLRFVAGSDACELVTNLLNSRVAEVKEWKDLTISTDIT